MTTPAEHREGKAEVKMDQLQAQKYDEIVDMLLAAGYFRARISALSQFDKIIGGLTWCITASNIDVDIDLFFEEEAQIKQKIELGERIEEALIRMKCPFPLQSYEIRGLNTPNIYPVIQWLVKKVIETRAETGDLLRLFSESRFRGSGYDLGQRDPTRAPPPPALSFVTEVNERYRPHRRYRRGTKGFQDEESRVQATLLEYGYKGSTSFIPPETEGEGGGRRRKKFEDDQERIKEQEEAARAERERVDAVMRTLAQIEGAGVSTNKLGSLVGTDADFIREIAGEYAKKSSDMDLNEAQLQQYFGAELHKRQVDTRRKQIQKEKEKIAELRERHDELEERMKQLQEDHTRRSALNKRIQQEIDKMQALETEENAEVLKTLRSLVALNEGLKKQEQDFRQTCKKQLQELQGMIKALQEQDLDEEEVKRLQLVEETYQSDKAKLQEIRQLAAKKTREIAMVQRKIDDIPSRTELQQYQRQFVELYEQVSSKFTETRKYYNSYNTLNDTLQFLQKEVSILNSIDENYKAAMSSKQNKEKLGESLKGIIAGVQKNVTKVEARLAEEKQKKDKLNADYMSALEKEREYYKMTKEFLDECDKNRQLLARIEG